MQISNLPTLYTSTNYNDFHFLPTNRDAEHWQKIAESVKKRDLLRYVPILVILIDGQKYIIDGQNRYLAAKSLMSPIYYFVVEDGNEDDMQILNLESVNWEPRDFLKFYANKGVKSYINIQKCLLDCPNIKLGYLISSIWQSAPTPYTNASKAFRQGAYIFGDEAIKKTRDVSRVLGALEKKRTGLVNKGSLVSAISSLVRADEFDIERMVSQIDKYHTHWEDQANQDSYRDHLEYIYNILARQGKKVSFKYIKRRVDVEDESIAA